MYVVVQHESRTRRQPSRGTSFLKNEGAPAGVRGLQFYPSRDGPQSHAFGRAPSVDSIQRYVDSTLGDSSDNVCYEVASEQAFSLQPSGIHEPAVKR